MFKAGSGQRQHSIYPPRFAAFTSHGFFQKLSTLVELISLLFYERAFHFPFCTFVQKCLLSCNILLSLFTQYLKKLLEFPFPLLCLSQLVWLAVISMSLYFCLYHITYTSWIQGIFEVSFPLLSALPFSFPACLIPSIPHPPLSIEYLCHICSLPVHRLVTSDFLSEL